MSKLAPKISKLGKKLDDLHKKKVRLRDSNTQGMAQCISCGRWVEYGTSNCQAGHYIPKGQSKFLRWEDDNVNVQCYGCNIMRNGNYHNYRQGMIDKYGSKREEELWSLRHKSSKGLITLDWLQERIKEEERQIKELQLLKGLK